MIYNSNNKKLNIYLDIFISSRFLKLSLCLDKAQILGFRNLKQLIQASFQKDYKIFIVQRALNTLNFKLVQFKIYFHQVSNLQLHIKNEIFKSNNSCIFRVVFGFLFCYKLFKTTKTFLS
ncbi:hypothetical protein EDEG_02742 [Edhazardia aedis USNM 41457]|uniref:Uncharacterized protein n=1 Tax=Edhazardia aedis (strain USNM 41457) TaxID=1003232 RepID=J9DNA2_EDHAE|nr:hypothetical protein EDEG_02742 [Edhazardia aedis USNM 41457]|eukprot:EJW02862.1 hypothetical protein EDEG_02742 [Edhazardia aedis USNM 41457]